MRRTRHEGVKLSHAQQRDAVGREQHALRAPHQPLHARQRVARECCRQRQHLPRTAPRLQLSARLLGVRPALATCCSDTGSCMRLTSPAPATCVRPVSVSVGARARLRCRSSMRRVPGSWWWHTARAPAARARAPSFLHAMSEETGSRHMDVNQGGVAHMESASRAVRALNPMKILQ